MAAYNKFNCFVQNLLDGVHDFSTHTFKVMLTNTAPDPAVNTVFADLVEIAAGNGYAAGGIATAAAESAAGGTSKVTNADVVWTAAGGTIGPFQYAVLYNATTGALVGFWDYAAALTLNDTETFTVDFDAVAGTFTLS